MRIGMISIRDNFDTRDYHDQYVEHDVPVPKQGRNEPGPPRKLAERCLEGEKVWAPGYWMPEVPAYFVRRNKKDMCHFKPFIEGRGWRWP